jgi:NIPSNAP protein
MHPSPLPISSAKVVELRQYTLRPGARQRLVDLFEAELVEPQEEAGMRLGGLFLDRDDPDRFVWFRGFSDLASRRRSLEHFYFGPVWEQFRDAANATMLDSDDVLLLGPTDPARPPAEPAEGRAAAGGQGPGEEWVTVCVYAHPPDAGLTRWLTEELAAGVERELGVRVATYRSEPATNDFPMLPVRQDNVFVWMAAFSSEEEYESAKGRLLDSTVWQQDISPRLESRLTGRQYLRLQPTGRSSHPAPGPAGG